LNLRPDHLSTLKHGSQSVRRDSYPDCFRGMVVSDICRVLLPLP
jgi:hypothetical protein